MSIRNKVLGLAALFALLATLGGLGLHQMVRAADPENFMVVTAPAGPHAVGDTFDATVAITSASTKAYATYQVYVAWTPDTILDSVPAHPNANVGGTHLATGDGYTACGQFAGKNSDANGPVGITSACGRPAGVLLHIGDIAKVTLKCIAEGSADVYLVDTTVSPTFGSVTVGAITDVDGVSTVECENQADIQTLKKVFTPAEYAAHGWAGAEATTAIAGTNLVYVVKAHNAGPNPAEDVLVGDMLPNVLTGDPLNDEFLPQKVLVQTAGASHFGLDVDGDTDIDVPAPDGMGGDPAGSQSYLPGGCVYYPHFIHPKTGKVYSHVVFCQPSALVNVEYPPGSGNHPWADWGVLQVSQRWQLELAVSIPLWDAGKMDVNIGQAGSLVTTELADKMTNEADCAAITHFDDDRDCVGTKPPSGAGACGTSGGIDEGPANEDPPGIMANNLGCAFTQVLPSDVTVTKSGAPNPATGGSDITWTITVTCGANGSPCVDPNPLAPDEGPIITDNVEDATQVALSAATIAGGTCKEGATPLLQLGSEPDVMCSLATYMDPGDVVTITFKAKVDPLLPAVTECDDTARVDYGDPLFKEQAAHVTCQPPVIESGIDKGSGVDPNPLAILVGQTARVTVWEQIEVVVPGPNPNLIHDWVVGGGAPNVTFDWVQHPTDSLGDANDNANGGVATFNPNAEALNFQTGPHGFGLVVVSRQLDVKCLAQTGPVTVNVSLVSKAGSSPTTFQVQCFNQPQEVKSPSQGNLWIMRHRNCLNQVTGNYDVGPCVSPTAGVGWLKINEVISAVADADSPNDADTNPEGLAAYEKQVKFDHKLVSLVVADAGLLGSTGRAVNCNLTIVTENWIMFGCVSTGTALGVTGSGPATLSTISVYPAPDLVERIRPTKDNGVVTPILDENCEWADIYGDPMLGMVAGGLVPICGDATLTIRMLEGDVNLDCNVDVLDEQAIAFRYGSSFGLLLYDQWFDLEPKLSDFDIDIKDLQFIFGRDGSTCANPIPLQPPSPPIP